MGKMETLLENIKHSSGAGFLRSWSKSILLLNIKIRSHLTSPPRPCSVPCSVRQVGTCNALPSGPWAKFSPPRSCSLFLLYSFYPVLFLNSQLRLRTYPNKPYSTQSLFRGSIRKRLLSCLCLPATEPGGYIRDVPQSFPNCYCPDDLPRGVWHGACGKLFFSSWPKFSLSLCFIIICSLGSSWKASVVILQLLHTSCSINILVEMPRCLECSKYTPLIHGRLKGGESRREEPEEIQGGGHRQAKLRGHQSSQLTNWSPKMGPYFTHVTYHWSLTTSPCQV